MTQTNVKELHYAATGEGDSLVENLKVVYLDGRVNLIDTAGNEPGEYPTGIESVLADQAAGEFDIFYKESDYFDAFDTPEQAAAWDAKFPEAQKIFG